MQIPGPGAKILSVDIFPVFLLQQIRHQQKYQQEKYNPDTEPLSFELHRLGNVNEEINQIEDKRIVLLLGQLALDDGLVPGNHLVTFRIGLDLSAAQTL